MNRCLLLSGGADSIALSYWLRPELSITVDYGQLAAEAEVAAAKRICAELSLHHKVIRVDCSAIGAGCMNTGDADAISFAPSPEWWPFRNQLLLTFAASICALSSINEIVIGSVASDAIHADGKPEFIESISRLIGLQEGNIRVSAPAKHMTSAELVRESAIPIPLLSWSHSCHRSNLACGQCRGCSKLFSLFAELGVR